jgi:son of sevenless-like protein
MGGRIEAEEEDDNQSPSRASSDGEQTSAPSTPQSVLTPRTEDRHEHLVWSKKDGGVEYGTLAEIIDMMTSDHYFDNQMLHAFFTTYRTFTDLEKIFVLFEIRFVTNGTSENGEKLVDPRRARVVSALRYWLENYYWFDFDGKVKAMRALKEFINKVKEHDEKLGEVLMRTLSKVKSNSLTAVLNLVHSPSATKPPPVLRRPKSKDNKIIRFPKLEISRQLALLNFTFFAAIDKSECLNQSWVKEMRALKAPNIHRATQHFNRISAWVVYEIVSELELSARARILSRFLNVANFSLQLNDFNAVFSVMSGINSATIYRLKKTWEAIPRKHVELYEKLNKYMSTDADFKAMRTAVRTCEPPCVPFIGIYLTDLTFIQEEAPDFIMKDDVRLINFAKCRKFAGVIRDIQTYQNIGYNLEQYDELRNLLMNLPDYDDKEMYSMSLLREPRAKQQ